MIDPRSLRARIVAAIVSNSTDISPREHLVLASLVIAATAVLAALMYFAH
jgi:hypothetical protein